MQQLALFDLDDTLVDRRAAFAAWAEEFVAEHGLDRSALALAVSAPRMVAGWPSSPNPDGSGQDQMVT